MRGDQVRRHLGPIIPHHTKAVVQGHGGAVDAGESPQREPCRRRTCPARHLGDVQADGCSIGVCEAAGRTSSPTIMTPSNTRSEEHTSELQSHVKLVCRLLLEKKKKKLICIQFKL